MLTQPIDRETLDEVSAFLFHEAELLDDQRIRQWLELLDPEVEYKMPVRTTQERAAGLGFSEESWHMNEDFDSLETRVVRLDTDYAWAEDPPSRSRRFVTNVRPSQGSAEDLVAVRSNLLLFRARYDNPDHQLLSAERHDVLRRADGGLKLLRRLVLLDHTTLGTSNLGIFL
ncbi:MAG: dioxygenase small subunit [Solirubrobacterales bacterium]|nr:dioxygenase small subunit [Solirubrobacterales bacterium]